MKSSMQFGRFSVSRFNGFFNGGECAYMEPLLVGVNSYFIPASFFDKRQSLRESIGRACSSVPAILRPACKSQILQAFILSVVVCVVDFLCKARIVACNHSPNYTTGEIQHPIYANHSPHSRGLPVPAPSRASWRALIFVTTSLNLPYQISRFWAVLQ